MFESGPLTNALTVGLPHAFLTERDEGYGGSSRSMMPMSRDLSALSYLSGLDTYTRVPQYLATMRHKNPKSCPMCIRKNSTLDDKPIQAA
jgi:hypothetical protein